MPFSTLPVEIQNHIVQFMNPVEISEHGGLFTSGFSKEHHRNWHVLYFYHRSFQDVVETAKEVLYFLEKTSSEIPNISPGEYFEAAAGRLAPFLRYTAAQEYDQKSIYLLGIKLAHGLVSMGKGEARCEVVEKALHIAGFIKDYKRVQTLLRDFMNVEKTDRFSQMIDYCRYGSLSLLKDLLASLDTPLQVTDLEKEKAFHEATFWGHVEVVDFLLHDKGFIISAITLKKSFLEVAGSGQIEMIQYLLEAFKERISPEMIKESFLLAAVHGHIKMLDFFLKGLRESISGVEVGKAFVKAASQGREDTLQFFLQRTRDPIFMEEIEAAFWEAAGCNQVGVLRFLLASRAKMISMHTLESAFLRAASFGYTEVVLLLQKKHVPISIGILAKSFRRAVHRRHIQVIQLLLKNCEGGQASFAFKVRVSMPALFQGIFFDTIRFLKFKPIISQVSLDQEERASTPSVHFIGVRNERLTRERALEERIRGDMHHFMGAYGFF